MDTLEIRPAVPEDAAKILALMKQIGAESENLTFGAEGLPFQVEEEAAFLRNIQQDERSAFLCAWKGKELIGTASLSALSRRMAHRGQIALSVLKSQWGQGIGSCLMRELIALARAGGLEILNLEVRSDNTRALRLYKKFGFRPMGTFPDFFKIDGRYADVEMMYLDLR